MSSLLLKNVRVFGQDGVSACLIEDGKIKAFNSKAQADKTIDCHNDLLLPSLIDVQSFFSTDLDALKDTAVKSGFGYVDAVLVDNRTQQEPKSGDSTTITETPPITIIGKDGKEKLAEIGLAHKAGKQFFSNGSAVIADNSLMQQAMSYIASLGGFLDHQPQDPALAADGVMHEGEVSARLGLKGIPPEAETLMLARDIELVRMTKCNYLVQQLSTAPSVEMIRAAKKEGLPIACSVSINHLLLNETAVGDFRTFCKLIPPLRTEADRKALIEGLKDGTINYIVSAHNAQSQETKRLPFEYAAAGSIGLETFLPAIFLLSQQENIPLATLLEKITSRPHKLAEGEKANIVCFNDSAPWTLDVATTPLPSKTQNSALDGLRFTGKTTMAILKGEVKFNARAD